MPVKDLCNMDDLQGFRNGNRSAMFAIYNTNYPGLLQQCRKCLNDEWESEEIVADAFCKLWTNREKINDSRHLHFYLRQVVTRRCIDVLRKRKRQPRMRSAEELGDHAEGLSTDEENVLYDRLDAHSEPSPQEILLKEMASMSLKRRTVLQLSLKDLSVEQIAAGLGIDSKTVYTHKYNAIRQIRERVQDMRQRLSKKRAMSFPYIV